LAKPEIKLLDHMAARDAASNTGDLEADGQPLPRPDRETGRLVYWITYPVLSTFSRSGPNDGIVGHIIYSHNVLHRFRLRQNV
jgi:hypothetical protein